MADLRSRLIKGSSLEHTSQLDKSKMFSGKDVTPVPVLTLNLALSSRIDGGVTSGLTTLAGESKTFKTMFGLLMMAAYLKKYPDAVALFYDTEFGSPPDYVKNFGIDMSRVIHCPVMNIEQFKFDIVRQLEGINRGDRVFIFMDSVGNIASKKEVDDAIKGNQAADMTRAKQLKSVGRMVTPYLTLNDIPMVVVNHTYKSQGMFPTDVVSGGTGIYYSSDNIIIVKKKQIKDGRELKGNNFILYIEKSRYVREKSRIPVKVFFDRPLSPYTGLFDLACDLGFIEQRKKGWYNKITDDKSESGKRRAEIEYDKAFWKDILQNTNFPDALHQRFSLGSLEQESDDDDEEESKEEADE